MATDARPHKICSYSIENAESTGPGHPQGRIATNRALPMLRNDIYTYIYVCVCVCVCIRTWCGDNALVIVIIIACNGNSW